MGECICKLFGKNIKDKEARENFSKIEVISIKGVVDTNNTSNIIFTLPKLLSIKDDNKLICIELEIEDSTGISTFYIKNEDDKNIKLNQNGVALSTISEIEGYKSYSFYGYCKYKLLVIPQIATSQVEPDRIGNLYILNNYNIHNNSLIKFNYQTNIDSLVDNGIYNCSMCTGTLPNFISELNLAGFSLFIEGGLKNNVVQKVQHIFYGNNYAYRIYENEEWNNWVEIDFANSGSAEGGGTKLYKHNLRISTPDGNFKMSLINSSSEEITNISNILNGIVEYGTIDPGFPVISVNVDSNMVIVFYADLSTSKIVIIYPMIGDCTVIDNVTEF